MASIVWSLRKLAPPQNLSTAEKVRSLAGGDIDSQKRSPGFSHITFRISTHDTGAATTKAAKCAKAARAKLLEQLDQLRQFQPGFAGAQ
jgi:hypothetical protein